MDFIYQISGEKVLCSVQEDYKKLESWKLGKETITQEAVENEGVIVRDNSILKVVDDVIMYDADAVAEKNLAIIDSTVNTTRTKVMTYQTGETDPRLDPNFYSTIVVGYGVVKSAGLKTATDCPNCQAITDWVNILWNVVWPSIKSKIIASEEYSLDFAQLMIDAGSTANPPYDFDECYAELM